MVIADRVDRKMARYAELHRIAYRQIGGKTERIIQHVICQLLLVVGEEHFTHDHDADQLVLRVCHIQISDECLWDCLTQRFNNLGYSRIGIHDTNRQFHSAA